MTQETMIQQLTAHLPTYYSNKQRESAKKTKARCGQYSFENFVEFIQEASLDANHPVFSRDALTQQVESWKRKKLPCRKSQVEPR